MLNGSLTVRCGGKGAVDDDDGVVVDVDVDVEEVGVYADLEEMEEYVYDADADSWWRGEEVLIESGGAPERGTGGEEFV